MNSEELQSVLQLLEQARVKIAQLRSTLSDDKNNEDSGEWMIDSELEEAASECKNAMSGIESAMESLLEEA